ncbi:uncharacterized protein [Nicotiana tomentosiformis]|uniref:uncharacterized protein n=1 Tax=Nicotiana tomentosiformis TaxID=4098 RepID=UPI00388CAAD2
MKIVAWIIRGLNKLFKQKELCRFIRMNKIRLLAILEHRVTETNANQILKKVAAGWRCVTNYETNGKGRIWVIWDPNILQFNEMVKSNQLIHGKVFIGALKLQFYFTAIYGLHTIEDRKILWHELEVIHSGTDGACIAMGDYNAILGVDDRVYGNPVQEVEIRDFRNFMLNNNMNELKYIGRKFTWTNNHVWSKIDIVIVNAEWMTIMKQMKMIVMDLFIADHSPLSIQFEDTAQGGPKPYHFYNYVA